MGILRILIGQDENEPLLGRASIGAFITLLIALGVNLTTDQGTALADVATFVLPVVVALIAATARSKVTPMVKVDAAAAGVDAP